MPIEIEKTAQRGARKRIKVTFPDGTVVCYKKVTDTFLEVLKKFDPELLATVGLEIGHLPMFSKTIYPGMSSYMKPLKDGWYVNTRNDSADKYIQLRSLNDKLNLGLSIEVATEMEGMESFHTGNTRKAGDKLTVFVGSQLVVTNEKVKEAFIATVEAIDTEMLARKSFEMFGKELVTRFKKYPTQVQLKNGHWVTCPNTAKDAIRIFTSLNEKFNLKIEWLLNGKTLRAIRLKSQLK